MLLKPPRNALPRSDSRWTPLYLEHGRLEVDDSSVKWISSTGDIIHIPCACLSCIMLGPGSTVTHAAVAAVAECRCPLFWVGEFGTILYASGLETGRMQQNALKHAKVWANKSSHLKVAKWMFTHRFDEDTNARSIEELRGMEGQRVKKFYKAVAQEYGVFWDGRNYNKDNWSESDPINKALSAANASLYSLCSACILNLGYLPQLGFIHSASAIAFSCDIADLVKTKTSILAAFQVIANNPADCDISKFVRLRTYQLLDELNILTTLPTIIEQSITSGL